MKSNNKLIGTGILTAIAASLCCITPVLALIAGTSGIAASFSWLEPFRPYLIALTILVIAFAWYQKLKPVQEIDCNCDPEEKVKFAQSKTFLGIVTLIAFIMLAFPYYSSLFYQDQVKSETIVFDQSNIQRIEIAINGMTCDGCAEHIDHEVSQLTGVVNSTSSYEDGNAVVEYDMAQLDENQIKETINSTGYTVIEIIKK